VLQNDTRLMKNPVVNNNIELKVTSTSTGKLQLLITDMSGKKILLQQINVTAGINQLVIPLPLNTARGIYTLQLEGRSIKKTIRVLNAGK